MAYLAAAVALYALHAGAPFWRLVSVSACLSLARYTPYAAAFAGSCVAAAFLADAPYAPVAVAGSLMIIAALALLGVMCVLFVGHALRMLLSQVRKASSAAIEGLRLYARIFWL